MINKENIERYTFSYLESLINNNQELAIEVEATSGSVLYYLNALGMKPSLSFFKEYKTIYASPYLNDFYPDVNWNDICDKEEQQNTGGSKSSYIFSLSEKLKKYSFDDFKKDKTILADFFIQSQWFDLTRPSNTPLDYSLKVRLFLKLLKITYPNVKKPMDWEEYFDTDFFDYVFKNIKDDLCIWNTVLDSPEEGVFVFALKSYLLDFALHDWFKNDVIIRRFYAKLSLALAKKQDFMIEPKFNHRIVPNLIQSNTLDILFEDLDYLFTKMNPVFISGLIDKHISVNLMLVFIFYLKSKSNTETIYGLVFDCLKKGLSKFDNQTTEKILGFLSFSSKKSPTFFVETPPLFINTDDSYNALSDLSSFMTFISYRLLSSLNVKDLEFYVKNMPHTWGNNHILMLEKVFSEKGFERLLIEAIENKESMFDFSSQIIAFMMRRSRVSSVLYDNFPSDFEKVFNEALMVEKISSGSVDYERKIQNNYVFKINSEVINNFKNGFLKSGSSLNLINRMMPVFLINSDFESLYLLIHILKKEMILGSGSNSKLVGASAVQDSLLKMWSRYLKELPITSLMLNVNNKFFVRTMYLMSIFSKIKGKTLTFNKLSVLDSKNVLFAINKFFLDKSIPLSWFPNSALTWKEQKEVVPGILMTQYNKSLNKNIQHKLSINEFKEMIVDYFDGFIMDNSKSEKELHLPLPSPILNPLFVNKHLKNFNKNIPLLLKELESRPEYYVIVALSAHPAMVGTLFDKLKFLGKMNMSRINQMNVKNLITLDFSKEFNKYEEIYLFLKNELNINWEICFTGIIKLVKNVYWVAKNRELDVQSTLIMDMVVDIFLKFQTVYSFARGIEQNKNVDYSYMLEAPFFHVLQDTEYNKFKSGVIPAESPDGKDNFITSLLKHIKYDLGNNDEVLPMVFTDFIKSIKKFGLTITGEQPRFYAVNRSDYTSRALNSILISEDLCLNINLSSILDRANRVNKGESAFVDNHINQYVLNFFENEFYYFCSQTVLKNRTSENFYELVKNFNFLTKTKIIKSTIDKKIAPIGDESCLEKMDDFKL